MMKSTDTKDVLRMLRRSLATAYSEIERVANFMEFCLKTEAERANCKEYGTLCNILGTLEEQITDISNQLKNKSL